MYYCSLIAMFVPICCSAMKLQEDAVHDAKKLHDIQEAKDVMDKNVKIMVDEREGSGAKEMEVSVANFKEQANKLKASVHKKNAKINCLISVVFPCVCPCFCPMAVYNFVMSKKLSSTAQ